MNNEAFHPLPTLDKELYHYFSVLGRALFTTQQLEMNCRAINVFTHLLDQDITISTSILENPEFQNEIAQLWKKTLGQHIKILSDKNIFSGNSTTVFEDARVSRNCIAHEIAMGVIDRLESDPDEQIAEIKDLVRKIAAADKIAALIIHVLNKDPIPNVDFFISYEDRVVAWVTENTFYEKKAFKLRIARCFSRIISLFSKNPFK